MARGCPTNCGQCAMCAEADLAYARFNAHAVGCHACHAAGGEMCTDATELCVLGFLLFTQWGRAEGFTEDKEAAVS